MILLLCLVALTVSTVTGQGASAPLEGCAGYPKAPMKRCPLMAVTYQTQAETECTDDERCETFLNAVLKALIPIDAEKMVKLASDPESCIDAHTNQVRNTRVLHALDIRYPSACQNQMKVAIDRMRRYRLRIPLAYDLPLELVHKGQGKISIASRVYNARTVFSVSRDVRFLKKVRAGCLKGNHQVCARVSSSLIDKRNAALLGIDFAEDIFLKSAFNNETFVYRGNSHVPRDLRKYIFSKGERPCLGSSDPRKQCFKEIVRTFRANMVTSDVKTALSIVARSITLPITEEQRAAMQEKTVRDLDRLRANYNDCGWSRLCRDKARAALALRTADIDSFATGSFTFRRFNGDQKRRKEYMECKFNCLLPFALMWMEAEALALRAQETLEIMSRLQMFCFDDMKCVRNVEIHLNMYGMEMVEMTRERNALPFLSVSPGYQIMGITTTSLALFLGLLTLLLGVVWKQVFKSRKVVVVIMVALVIANALRVSWWAIIRDMLTISRLHEIYSLGRFVVIPDIVINLLWFLATFLFLYKWVIAMNSLFFSNEETVAKVDRIIKIGFIVFALIISLYCVAIIILYSVTGSVKSEAMLFDLVSQDPFLSPFEIFPRHDADKTLQLLGILNLVVCCVLIFYCVLGLNRLWGAGRDKIMGIVKFLVIAVVLFVAFTLKAITVFAIAVGHSVTQIFEFGISVSLAEFMITGAMVYFGIQAFYNASHHSSAAIEVQNPDSKEYLLNASDSMEMEDIQVPAAYRDI